MALTYRQTALSLLDPLLSAEVLSTHIQQVKNHHIPELLVPSFWVKKAVRELEDTEGMVSTAVGYPHGFQLSQVKELEAKEAIAQGALGIELVWSQSAHLSGMTWPKIEVAKLAKLCHEEGCLLSVMVQADWVKSREQLLALSKMIQDGGADFITLGVGPADIFQPEQLQILRENLSSQIGIKVFWDSRKKLFAEQFLAAGADRVLVTRLPRLD
ncbi:hypothetical protein [Algoriphagus namhaensis]